MNETLRARGEHDVATRFVDCVARGSYPLERQIEVIKRIAFVTGEVFNRQSGNAGIDAQPDIGRHLVRIVGIAALEVGVQRNIRCVCDFAIMGEHHVAGDVTVRIADRVSIARARRRQRLEAEALHVYRALPTFQGLGMTKQPL